MPYEKGLIITGNTCAIWLYIDTETRDSGWRAVTGYGWVRCSTISGDCLIHCFTQKHTSKPLWSQVAFRLCAATGLPSEGKGQKCPSWLLLCHFAEWAKRCWRQSRRYSQHPEMGSKRKLRFISWGLSRFIWEQIAHDRALKPQLPMWPSQQQRGAVLEELHFSQRTKHHCQMRAGPDWQCSFFARRHQSLCAPHLWDCFPVRTRGRRKVKSSGRRWEIALLLEATELA